MAELRCEDCDLSFEYPSKLQRHKDSKFHKIHAGRLQSVTAYEDKQELSDEDAVCVAIAPQKRKIILIPGLIYFLRMMKYCCTRPSVTHC